MLFVIAGVGAFISAVCIAGMISPEKLAALAPWFLRQRGALWIAVVARLAIGALLILAAPASRFPLGFQILGGLMILAAVVLPFLGIEGITKIVNWVLRWPPLALRAWLLLGLALGVFMVYGTGLV